MTLNQYDINELHKRRRRLKRRGNLSGWLFIAGVAFMGVAIWQWSLQWMLTAILVGVVSTPLLLLFAYAHGLVAEEIEQRVKQAPIQHATQTPAGLATMAEALRKLR